jgi:hypothetical protein
MGFGLDGDEATGERRKFLIIYLSLNNTQRMSVDFDLVAVEAV